MVWNINRTNPNDIFWRKWVCQIFEIKKWSRVESQKNRAKMWPLCFFRYFALFLSVFIFLRFHVYVFLRVSLFVFTTLFLFVFISILCIFFISILLSVFYNWSFYPHLFFSLSFMRLYFYESLFISIFWSVVVRGQKKMPGFFRIYWVAKITILWR